MPDGYPIRNINIEAAHTVLPSKVTTRQMTPEEWEKYGPKVDKLRLNIKKEGIDPVKKKLTIPIII
ncbi:MAG: hypothetical protein GX625_14410, partial [Clostridiaceae bacterium]|nr:hypothetical protein [Clostridiaceae bacterium]